MTERKCQVAADELDSIVDGLMKSYENHGGINHLEGPNLPSRQAVRSIGRSLESLLFPGFVEAQRVDRLNLRYFIGRRAAEILDKLTNEVSKSFHFAAREGGPQQEVDEDAIWAKATCVTKRLLESLPHIRHVLATDAKAALVGDPAASSAAEVLVAYPGLHAIAIHRVAHFLYKEGVPLIPRMMTEWVHSATGIDIHPGATIGEAFFIDHGTGVVIGETSHIGDRVKIYQGVTLGALSVPSSEVSGARGEKRHPTIEDDVTIYAGATILGGDTVIGTGSIVGGNVWVTRSVPPGTKVLFKRPRLRYGSAESPGLVEYSSADTKAVASGEE